MDVQRQVKNYYATQRHAQRETVLPEAVAAHQAALQLLVNGEDVPYEKTLRLVCVDGSRYPRDRFPHQERSPATVARRVPSATRASLGLSLQFSQSRELRWKRKKYGDDDLFKAEELDFGEFEEGEEDDPVVLDDEEDDDDDSLKDALDKEEIAEDKVEEAGQEETASGCPDGFVLNFLWLDRYIAVAVDQIFSGKKRSPLTEYFIWPRTDAWAELLERLAENSWIDETDRVLLLNRTTQVINYWQDENEKHTIEDVRRAFPDCVFMGA